MYKLIALLALSVCAFAQSPAVNVTTAITASAGNLTCTGTPGVNGAGAATMHLVCTASGGGGMTADATVPTTPASSVTTSVQSGTNTIALLLTKGNSVPDQWQVTASDGTVTKFKSGIF